MKKRLYLLALLVLLAAMACDSANPVAPAGTVLTVTANPTRISLSGSSTITITGFRPDGNPLPPGTQIQVDTDLGELVDASGASVTVVSTDSSGRATFFLRASGETGAAMVSARTVGGGEEVMVTVNIGEDETTRPTLSLIASPTEISPYIGTSTITVIARNADGSNIGPGQTIRLRTSLGTLGDETVTTDASGEATTVLTAGSTGGSAEVVATMAPANDSDAVAVMIRNPELVISANPTEVDAGGVSEITAFATDTVGTNLGAGLPITFLVSGGTLDRSSGITNENGEVRASFTAGDDPAADGTVQGFLPGAMDSMATIGIRDVVDQVSLNVNPSSVPIGDDVDITLTATLTNALGRLVNEQFVVSFEADEGTFTNGNTDTATGGQATVTLRVTNSELQGVGSGNSFTVTATVSTPSGPKSDTKRVDIQ